MSEQHMFQPFVTLSLREDGRYDVEFDFRDSYTGVNTDDGYYDPDTAESRAACHALDQWVRRQRCSFIIEPANQTYHGITEAHCLICGHSTTDITEMEMWNDLSVNCIKNEHETGAVRWTLADGTVCITTQDAEGNLTTTTKEVRP